MIHAPTTLPTKLSTAAEAHGFLRADHPVRCAAVVAPPRIAVFSPSTVREPFLTPTTIRSVEHTGAGVDNKAVKQAAHTRSLAWQVWGKLSGMFGNQECRPQVIPAVRIEKTGP